MSLDRTHPSSPATSTAPARWARLCSRLGRFCHLLHATHTARVPF